ncbi:MAG: hypothetical protein GXP59_01820 [Deltaproteobacteria bacterium]|nr:hypothetical protein [Deltaproteobacteria bacterium]
MMRKKLIIVAALILSLTTVSAYAGMNMDMSGMNMKSGKMIMLPMTAANGVSAMAHLMDIKASMRKMDMAATNHFMIMFTDKASKKPLTGGIAALKITRPDGHTDKPLRMMAMKNAFGVNIVLTDKGTYEFTVGTRLTDGQKRTFKFKYTLK